MPRITAFLCCLCHINILQASCPSSSSSSFETQRSLLIRSTICTGKTRGLYNYVQACTDKDEKFGHLGCLTTSPGLTRSRGQSILLEPGKWFAFLNKSPYIYRTDIYTKYIFCNIYVINRYIY